MSTRAELRAHSGTPRAHSNTRFGIDNFRTEEALAGDYNRDGSVDAADYVVWRDTVGQQSPQLAPNKEFLRWKYLPFK